MLYAYPERVYKHLIDLLLRSFSWDLLVLARLVVGSGPDHLLTLYLYRQTELSKALAGFLFNDEQRGL